MSGSGVPSIRYFLGSKKYTSSCSLKSDGIRLHIGVGESNQETVDGAAVEEAAAVIEFIIGDYAKAYLWTQGSQKLHKKDLITRMTKDITFNIQTVQGV